MKLRVAALLLVAGLTLPVGAAVRGAHRRVVFGPWVARTGYDGFAPARSPLIAMGVGA